MRTPEDMGKSLRKGICGINYMYIDKVSRLEDKR